MDDLWDSAEHLGGTTQSGGRGQASEARQGRLMQTRMPRPKKVSPDSASKQATSAIEFMSSKFHRAGSTSG